MLRTKKKTSLKNWFFVDGLKLFACTNSREKVFWFSKPVMVIFLKTKSKFQKSMEKREGGLKVKDKARF